MRHKESLCKFFGILGFTALGFVVMGYHPGLEDDAVYLSAVKAHLNSALFPFHPEFFQVQLEATFFDGWIARSIQLTGMPVEWAELFWQLMSLFLALWACYRLARRLFASEIAQWAAVATVSAMFTLPVAGTALFLMDQHLHPRNLATALTLLAVAEVLDGRRWSAVPLLGVGFLLHPIMAAMGISFCVFLSLALTKPVPQWVADWVLTRPGSTAALIPLGWVIEPANSSWKKALDTRSYYYLYKWHWYEWLGAIAPLILFWVIWRMARKRGNKTLSCFAGAVFAYAVFHQVMAMVLLAPRAWVRLTPFQPMRYLQLVYFFMILILGGLIGQYMLKKRIWCWAAFLFVANGGMLLAQRAEFSASQHLEWPGRVPDNPWLQAFAWIRTNTPLDAYFALDPHYLEAPGEDYHGFRGLAERSQLADMVKDAATVTQVPELSAEWDREVTAEEGWRHFGPEDFGHLKRDFGVNWVVVELRQARGLDCRWHNQSLAVCAIP